MSDGSALLRYRPQANTLQPVAGMLAWIFIYVVANLGLWIAIAVVATGWDPIVITSGSMQPTLRPGDVVLLDEHPTDGLVPQASVISYETERDPLVTHRVFAVEDQAYVTKGDANPTPDTDAVSPDAVIGVGRLVVPFVGLPVVWLEERNVAALTASAVLAVGAVSLAFSGSRGHERRRSRIEHGSFVAEKAIRRVRVLVGVMILSQFLVNADRFDVDGLPIERWQMLAISLGILAVISGAAMLAARGGNPAVIDRVSIVELVGDTALVVLLTMATGTAGIGWVLFALPIIEAAARFRLSGALAHWMALTGITLLTRLWVLERTEPGSNALIAELEQIVDQLSVLLLVVIPGAHLVEQLLGDVLTQRRATSAAVERGRLLQHVAEIGNEVNRLGSELFPTMADSVLQLGFDEADVCMRGRDGSWQVLASSAPTADSPALPPPGEPGSTLDGGGLEVREACIDRDDHDLDDWLPVAASGLQLVVRFVLSEVDGTLIALRAAVRQDHQLPAGAIEAVRLLSAQATVALQNDRLMTELHDAHLSMERQARHDALTGLPNRAFFLERLNLALDEATDPDRRYAVLFIDLDGFKPVNDQLGHDAGDALLVAVAGRLENALGPDAIVARLGGDEFTALLDERVDSGSVGVVLDEVDACLRQPYRIGVDHVSVGASIGVAYSEPGLDSAELLRRADAAMYSIKGGDEQISIATYDWELDAADRRRARLTSELAKALQRDGLHLLYQPIMVVDGGVAGVEALLRWTHRELGRISTATILELAESAGLLPDLNKWITGRVATDARRWGIGRNDPFFVAINVSPAELSSDYLIRNVEAALLSSGLQPRNMVVELSERIVGPESGFRQNIEEFEALGVQLALDDFGEGRTSLGHLRGLPISMLKVDRTLVQQAVRSGSDRIILESVSRLAHELGFVVVAEGVETEEQLAAVVDAGCDLIQGFLLHRPKPPAEIAALIQTVGFDAAGPAAIEDSGRRGRR